MTTTIITQPAAPILAILGENGEHHTRGWGNYAAPPGETINTRLYGAVRRCCPVPGDAHIVEQVMARRGRGIGWNDDRATSWADIRAHIGDGWEITDDDLADTFGPQWEHIVALVRRIVVLTRGEVVRLASAASAAWVWASAASAAWASAYAASASAASAASALAVRSLIGQGKITQSHYARSPARGGA